MSNKEESKPIVNQISEGAKKSLKSRVIVAIVLAIIAIPCVVIGSWAYLALTLVGMAFGVFEIIRAPQKKYSALIYVIAYASTLLLGYWWLVQGSLELRHFSLEGAASSVYFPAFVVILDLALLFFLSIKDENFTVYDLSFVVMSTLLLGLGIASICFLRYYPFHKFNISFMDGKNMFNYWQSLELFAFVLLGTMANDIFAYFTGMLFGKHHMTPRVSPKKTWEGFFGGWIIGAVIAIAFAFICQGCGSPMLPDFKWYWIIVLGILIPLFGDLGDLAFSLIKRFFGFKDYSHVLKAHGGILDRLDSIIFVSMATSMVLMIADLIA